MKIISHRGNLEGLTPSRENSPSFIDEAINSGYDVEIDLRINDGELYLGHDKPQYKIKEEWLSKRREKLWIHAKDSEAFFWLHKRGKTYRYFWHTNEDYTLISNGIIWCHDIKKHNKQCIIPLLSEEQIAAQNKIDAFGICTDFVLKVKNKLKEKK